jgi:hypothetical protein
VIPFEHAWWGAEDGPGGGGPGSGDPIDVPGTGSVDFDAVQAGGCVSVPEASAGAACVAGALAPALLAARRRCAASSSA